MTFVLLFQCWDSLAQTTIYDKIRDVTSEYIMTGYLLRLHIMNTIDSTRSDCYTTLNPNNYT